MAATQANKTAATPVNRRLLADGRPAMLRASPDNRFLVELGPPADRSEREGLPSTSTAEEWLSASATASAIAMQVGKRSGAAFASARAMTLSRVSGRQV